MWSGSKKTTIYLESITKFSRSQWLFQSSSFSTREKIAPLQERKMIDQFRLYAKGGDGGSGCNSVRRSRHNRHGKPDGGDGGKGGDVILESSTAVWDFRSLQHHINAKRGGNGTAKNMIGSRGADKVVMVPIGTVIHLLEGELPSAVEKKTSGVLDPWDLPGTLGFPGTLGSNSSESSQQSTSEGSKDMDNSASSSKEVLKKPTSHLSSTSRSKPRNQTEPDFFPKPQGYCDGEEMDGEVIVSGSEFEEDMEEEMKEVQYNVAELTEPGQRITVARGGEGGLGNLHLGKASKPHKNGADSKMEASDDDDDAALNVGTPGTEAVLLLELKSIADVGLVGMPNAGKSTLLGALSRAKPTVGHYAFTTLRPNLGNITFDDLSITVADIPGLIKGAHENRGLGHAFLRHIERTKVLAYVVDLAAAIDGRKGIPPWEQLKELMLELEYYNEGLSTRPSLVVANKIDEAGAEEVYEELRKRVHGVRIFPVCAVLGEGITELRAGLKMLVDGEEVPELKLDCD